MNRKLAALAKLYGVQTSYVDMRHQRCESAPESVLLALRALGAPVEGMHDIDAALEMRRRESASSAAPVVAAAVVRPP